MNRVNKATHPTDAAALAVELLLVLVIVQFALVAEIFPEQRAAAAAVLLHRLPQPAHAALDLRILFKYHVVKIFVVCRKYLPP